MTRQRLPATSQRSHSLHTEEVDGPRPRRSVASSVWAFPVLYLGWAYLWWLPVLRSEESVWSGTNLVWFLLGGASPMLAGLVLAWATGGAARLRDLAHRLVDTRRITSRWWVLLLGFWLVFYLAQGAAAVVLGVTGRPFDIAWEVLGDPGAIGFLVLLSFVFPAVEEIGLRGYWLDRLQERFSTTTSALVNGVAWAVWHAPFVYFPGYYDNTTFDPDLSWWMPMIVCDTILYVWVHRHTRQSILAVLVFHAMMNLTGELLGITPQMYPFVLWTYVLAAAAVVVSWRRSAGASAGTA